MSTLLIALMLYCTVAFASVSAFAFDMKSLDGADVLFIQPLPTKKGWKLITLQNKDGIYIVHLHARDSMLGAFYCTGHLHVLATPQELEEQIELLHALGKIYDNEESLVLLNDMLDTIVGRSKKPN